MEAPGPDLAIEGTGIGREGIGKSQNRQRKVIQFRHTSMFPQGAQPPKIESNT